MVDTNEYNEKKKYLLDLHIHTSNSDAEESPDVVIEKAKEAGLSLIAITDHNKFTFTTCKEVDGMLVIPGIEFSTEYYVLTRNETTEIHIVGIFPDGVNELDFEDVFEDIGSGKEEYVTAILEDLATRGICITMEEVYGVKRKCEHVGRHQIAEILVNKGIEPNIDSAYDHQIGNFSPYYIPSTRYIHYATMDIVIKKILECGGIPCLAHPYGYMFNEEEIEQLIKHFKEVAGEKAAMEVFYERYLSDSSRMNFLRKMQKKYKILTSCGSDRHRPNQSFATGGNKKIIDDMLFVLGSNIKLDDFVGGIKNNRHL